jgi:tetratricopeptide (TPR) repeat protein
VGRSAEYLDKWLANSDDDPKACFYRASMKYAQGMFNEALTKADECIKAGGTSPYPNLFGLKALAYNRLNDSINARSNYEEYFKRQDPDKVGAGDYSSYAAILLKFPGNEALAGSYVQKAVALDTIEANKVAYLKSLAQAYDNQKKVREAGYWYSKVLDVKKNYSNVDIYNAGYGYFRAGVYDTAAMMFKKYTEKYPEDIFGYYMVAKAYSGMDSTGEKGLAVPSYEKAIAIGEAAADKEKVKNQLIGSYKFFIEYYYNVKKDQATALTYVEKALALDPSDAQLISNKEFISKNDPKAIRKPTPPKTPAKPKAPSTPKKK